MLTHLTQDWLNGPDCTRIEGLLLPISVKLHASPSCSSPLITHTQNPLPPRQLLLQPESFLSEAWSSISVQSRVVMALLVTPLLRWCVSSCTISPLPVAFSLLGGPRIVHRCSTDPPSQGAHPINIQLERKITTVQIWGIKLGLDIWKSHRRGKLGQTGFLTYF